MEKGNNFHRFFPSPLEISDIPLFLFLGVPSPTRAALHSSLITSSFFKILSSLPLVLSLKSIQHSSYCFVAFHSSSSSLDGFLIICLDNVVSTLFTLPNQKLVMSSSCLNLFSPSSLTQLITCSFLTSPAVSFCNCVLSCLDSDYLSNYSFNISSWRSSSSAFPLFMEVYSEIYP